MAKRLIPTLNRVLVEKITAPAKTNAGILLPEKSSKVCSYSSRASRDCNATAFFVEDSRPRSAPNSGGGVFHLSALCRDSQDSLKDCRIELVDDETWRVSSGLAEAWRGHTNVALRKTSFFGQEVENDDYVPLNENHPDFDDIQDLRIRGNLFYKIDKDSKEYEEYKFEFHRRSKNKNDNGNDATNEKTLKSLDEKKQNKKEKSSYNSSNGVERSTVVQDYQLREFGASATKKTRTPTYNQLTAPYHEPFCLDIYVSKGSVRASIIHRATSKVVTVAHSISKDMKFDLGSTKNKATCFAVGELLAQRALADDIHNAVYTPRKGEKLEGKLEIVLQSIINNGIDVKVKIKQRKNRKVGFHLPTA